MNLTTSLERTLVLPVGGWDSSYLLGACPMSEERDQNDQLPIVGPYADFGRMVQQLMRGLSSRQGQIRTGVSHSTITDMMKGIRPKSSTIERLARGFRVDPNPLLVAASYPKIEYEVMGVVPAGANDSLSSAGIVQTTGDLDPLLLIGREVSSEPLARIEHIASGASGGVERYRNGELPPMSTADVLPQGARTVVIETNDLSPQYQRGDILFVMEGAEPKDGDTVIALVDLTRVLARVYRTGGKKDGPYLEPATPEEMPIPKGRFTVSGVIAGYFRRTRD